MTPSHARTKTAHAPGLWAAWAVLLTMGGTSVTLNIWDATHVAHLFWLIATLKGLAPVGAAMGLSEVGARYDGGKVFRGLCFAVMGGAMALSMSAIAAVVRPGSPLWAAWLFGVVLDAAALICLNVILTSRGRKARFAAEREAERAEMEAARAAAAAQAEAARVAVAEASARVAEANAEAAARVAEVETVSAELAAANGALEALRAAAHTSRSKRPKSAASRARTSADTQDLTTELRAMQMLDAHPELRAKGQGAELARRLGVHPSTGRRLLAQLTSEERLSESAHARADARSADAAHERTDER